MPRHRLSLLLVLAFAPIRASGQSPQLVDIGGYRLDVVRAGAGGPAVIFEAGLGDALDDWAKIWPEAATFTSVVAYSRAGLGRSDAGPGDHSARAEMAQLHALLGALHVPPPYVLAARSYGGLLARLYASLYPKDVAGIVLVDGTHEQQVRRWGMLDSAYPGQFYAYFDSALKTLKPGAEAAETRETVRIQRAGTVEGLTPLPDIPMAILTSMKSDSAGRYVNGTARGHDAWRAMHDEWFRRSRNAEHIVTTRSGHAIQDDEPQLVIDAIRFVVEKVRGEIATPTR